MDDQLTTKHDTLLSIKVLFNELLEEIKKLPGESQNPSSIKIFTISDVAQILKCKERSVKHHLYEARDLKYLIIGREVRILEEDLKKFLENRLTPCISSDQEILP